MARPDTRTKGGVAGQIPAREQKPEAMHRRRLAACPCPAPRRPTSFPFADSSCYCFCHTSRFAKSCAWHFGLVFHSALTFTLPSLILSCLPTLPLATCRLPLACHAAIGQAERSATSTSIATSSWLNMHYWIYHAFRPGYCGWIKRADYKTVCTYIQSRQCVPTYKSDNVPPQSSQYLPTDTYIIYKFISFP